MPFSPLPVGQFRFSLTVTEEIVLPPYKGFAFRGVFGTVLRELACVLPGENCPNCPFRYTCTYAYLFETSPAEGVDGFRRFSNFPRPYIIHPPHGDKRHYRRYDSLQFEFVLIGRASETIPQVIMTFEEIGQRGIRNGSGKFMIDQVVAIGNDASEQIIYSRGRLNGSAIPVQSISLEQTAATASAVLLNFYTPLLLEERGRIQYEPPRFSLLIEHLVRRIMLLQALHGSGGIQPDQMQVLLEQTAAVEIQTTDMQWKSMERISNRQQARIKTGGLIGQITYSGKMDPYIPLLHAGQKIHAGKSTTFGFGGYRLQIS